MTLLWSTRAPPTSALVCRVYARYFGLLLEVASMLRIASILLLSTTAPGQKHRHSGCR